MQGISKYLATSALLLAVALLVTWIAVENKAEAPYRLVEYVAAQFKTNNSHATDQASPIRATTPLPAATDSTRPTTLTYYRWTDSEGNAGYSKELPANVSAFKAIVLEEKSSSL